jgi:Stress responsive A/B Barrel Domain
MTTTTPFLLHIYIYIQSHIYIFGADNGIYTKIKKQKKLKHTKKKGSKYRTVSMPLVKHIVFIKTKADASPAAVENMVRAIDELRSIPAVNDISVGETFSDRGKGFTHALVTTHDSKEALREYRDHPQHVKTVDTSIVPVKDDVIAIDYEYEPHYSSWSSWISTTTVAIVSLAIGAAGGYMLGQKEQDRK